MKKKSERICFEVIAPPTSWRIDAVRERAASVARILAVHDISRLNLPEVVEESGFGQRTVPYAPKMDPVRFGELIRSQRPDVCLIPHRRSVRLPEEGFARWVQEIVDKKIKHIVVVGGESHTIHYPGLPVPEAAALVKRRFPRVKVGGITIFNRKNETERIISKVRSGVTFFLSQILFDAAPMKQVLAGLKKRCESERLEFPTVYVSLAPAARIRDVEFMQWLGVSFPPTLLSQLANATEKRVQTRTFEVLKRLIDDVVEFEAKRLPNVGFNIGHVLYDNLDLAEKLVELVKRRTDA